MPFSIKPGTESEVEYRRLLSGLFGSAILLIGALAAPYSIFEGEAAAITSLLAIVSSFLILMKRYKGLWLTGIGSLSIIIFTFVQQITPGYSFWSLGWGYWIFLMAGVALLIYSASLSPFEKKTHNRILLGIVAALSVAMSAGTAFTAFKSQGIPIPPPIESETLMDERDGKKYKTVKIGSQVWMAENLSYDASGSKCYDNDPEYCAKYGRFYSWEMADTVCPAGWHLPNDLEWDNLEEYIGNDSLAGKRLKAVNGWRNNGNGTDNYGFSALPGGIPGNDGNFEGVGTHATWLSASKSSGRSIGSEYEYIYRYSVVKSGLGYVRCIKDEAPKKDTLKSQTLSEKENPKDANETVVIGTQVWMKYNMDVLPIRGNSWCYGDDPKNCEKYGRLYDWNAVQAVCPAGFRIPAVGDWDKLEKYVGNSAGKKLKSKDGWDGTDEYGFSALPGGYKESFGGFSSGGRGGIWWTASEKDNKYFYRIRYMGSDRENIYGSDDTYSNGFSVRCLKDLTTKGEKL